MLICDYCEERIAFVEQLPVAAEKSRGVEMIERCRETETSLRRQQWASEAGPDFGVPQTSRCRGTSRSLNQVKATSGVLASLRRTYGRV